MGVDYCGVGGIGIQITPDDEQTVRELAATIDATVFEDNFGELLDWFLRVKKVKAEYSEAGSANYRGDATWYIHAPGYTLDEIYSKAEQFLEDLLKIGLKKTREDLKVISDLYIY